MEAVKPKTKAKKPAKVKHSTQEPAPQEQAPEARSEEPKVKENNAAKEVEKPMEAQEAVPQEPKKSGDNEKSAEPKETFGKDFDALLKDKDFEKIYPKLKEDDNEQDQEKEEEVRQRMAQYAEATREKLDMMTKFLEEIDERESENEAYVSKGERVEEE